MFVKAKEVLESIAPNAWLGLDADEDINKQLEDIAAKVDKNLRDIMDHLPETKTYVFPDIKVRISYIQIYISMEIIDSYVSEVLTANTFSVGFSLF